MRNVLIALNWLTIQSPPHTTLYSIHRFPLNEVSVTSVTVRQFKISNYSTYTKHSDVVKKNNETEPNRNSKNRPNPEPNRSSGRLLSLIQYRIVLGTTRKMSDSNNEFAPLSSSSDDQSITNPPPPVSINLDLSQNTSSVGGIDRQGVYVVAPNTPEVARRRGVEFELNSSFTTQPSLDLNITAVPNTPNPEISVSFLVYTAYQCMS